MADTLTITDNRTGKQYDVPIHDGAIKATDLRQIKINDQYRMRFKLDTATSPPTVTVTFIGDPH